MEIKNVELLQPQEDKPESGALNTPVFYVEAKDGNKIYVPLDPANRHYADVQAWYESRRGTKPFEFDFSRPERHVKAAQKLATKLNKQLEKQQKAEG